MSRIDVLIITALPDEFNAARDVASEGSAGDPGVARWDEHDRDDPPPYLLGEYKLAGGGVLTVALAKAVEKGATAAGAIAGPLVERLRPGCVAMCGVCAGNPAEVMLGDVIVASFAYRYEEGKRTREEFQSDHRQTPIFDSWLRTANDLSPHGLGTFREASPEDARLWLLERLLAKENPRTHLAFRRYFPGDSWGAMLDTLESEGLIIVRVDRPRLTDEGRDFIKRVLYRNAGPPHQLPYRIAVGAIVSGDVVVKDGVTWKQLAAHGVKTVVGLEMEAATIARTARGRDDLRWTVVKGVMDYADPRKNDHYKPFAARASADVMFRLLATQLAPRAGMQTAWADKTGRARAKDPAQAAGPPVRVINAPLLPVPRQLPLVAHDFVGRAAPLAALNAAARPGWTSDAGPARLVIVDGTAGVGKTTLAVHWAHRAQNAFPDGTLFANLHGYGPGAPLDPASVLVSFLRALGFSEERIPFELDVVVGLYRSLVAGRRMLILLDNAGSAEQVRPLLPGSTGSLVLVTSRAKLTGLLVAEAAHRVTLDPFIPTEAEDLVRGVIGADRVTAEPDAVAELVRLCAGLPLAVRVAASRIAVRRYISIADVVDDIASPQDRLNVLSSSGDDPSAVRAVLDWSYTRLPAGQARMFRRLGLHPTPWFGLHAAAALTGLDVTSAYRNLEALADVHLVEPVDRTRYRFHDLLHVYAAHRAELDDALADRVRALAAMVAWYAQTATFADRLVFPAHPALPVDLGTVTGQAVVTDRAQAWSWLTSEHATLLAVVRLAAEHDMLEATIALAAATRFLAMQPRALWTGRLEAESRGLIAARASGDRTAEAMFRRRRADTHQMMGHWAESDADLDCTIALALEIDDPLLRGEALCGLGRNRKLQQRYDEARICYRQALPLVRGSGYVEAVVECNLSQISARLGHCQDAVDHARRELVLRRRCGDRVGEGYALHDMVVAEQGLGNHDAAIELGERALAIYRNAVATEQFLAGALETVAISLEHTGNHARAGQYRREAANILTGSGDPYAEVLHTRGRDLASPAASPCDR